MSARLAAVAAGAGGGATAAAVAAGAGGGTTAAGAAAAAPCAAGSITAMTSCATTVAPSGLLISVRTPAAGAGSSSTTLSVSTSTRFSSRLTASPTFLCQLTSVASATDSGNTGTFTSIDMMDASCLPALRVGASVRGDHLARRELGGEGVGDQLLLLREVLRGVAHGGRSRDRPPGVGQQLLFVDVTAQIG